MHSIQAKSIPLYLWWCILPTSFIDALMNKKTREKDLVWRVKDCVSSVSKQSSAARKGVTRTKKF